MAIKAKCNHSYLYISPKLKNANRRLRRSLVDTCSYVVGEKEQATTYCLLRQTKRGAYRVPLGLLSRIKKVFAKYGETLNLKFPEEPESDYMALFEGFNGKLRKYQKKAYDIGLKERRGIFDHATGSGKTILASALIFSINRKTLYVVPNITLLKDTAKEIVKFTEYDVGLFGEGYKDINKHVTVATAQSVYSWLKRDPKKAKEWLRTIECFMADEVHHSGSDSWKSILMHCINSSYRFGFTGTVHRGDGATLLLHAVTGETIHKVSSSKLIRLGYLAKPYFYFIEYEPEVPDYAIDKTRNWHAIVRDNIVGNKRRNSAIIKIATKLKKKLSTLILCDRVNHGVLLKDNIKNSRFLSGASSSAERSKMKRKLQKKSVRCLIATSIFDEGVNIPALGALIKSGGGKAQNSDKQRTGRALRRSEGKDKVLIVDFLDYSNSTTKKHSLMRADFLADEEEFVVRKITLDKFMKTKIKNLMM